MDVDPFAGFRAAPATVSTSYTHLLDVPPVPLAKASGGTQKSPETLAVPRVPLVTPAKTEAPGSSLSEAHFPPAWMEAIAALEAMRVPKAALLDRWQQIVGDARAFMARSGRHAVDAGWQVGDVFGFDPDGASTDLGIAFLVRGGTAHVMGDGTACISWTESTRRVWFTPGRMPADIPMIWHLDRVKQRQATQKTAENRG